MSLASDPDSRSLLAVVLGAAPVDKLQAHCYVSVFYAPLLAVSHILILINLLKRGNELKTLAAVAR